MKKGFTLIELIAVIAIMGIIILLAVPNIIKIYNNSVTKSMELQENQILDAANLFIVDYCGFHPIKELTSDLIQAKGLYINDKIVCLDSLISENYIEDVKYNNSTCKGMIKFDSNGKNGKTYLYCGASPDYVYKTNDAPNIDSRCN